MGLRNNNASVGRSDASANDAKVSVIKLTQSIWTAFKGELLTIHAPVKATMMATTLTVSWNCRNLEIESYTFRPQMTALTIEVKLSSVRIMSDASLATSVPAMPIAKPTSAFFNAGPSLVPSPVTATTSRFSYNFESIIPFTSVCLSVGEERANTLKLGQTLSNSA